MGGAAVGYGCCRLWLLCRLQKISITSVMELKIFLINTYTEMNLALDLLAKFPDPQVSLALLCYCLGAQKINHLLRVMWTEDFAEFVGDTTDQIRTTLEDILGSHLPDPAWLKSCLSVRLGGLGVQSGLQAPSATRWRGGPLHLDDKSNTPRRRNNSGAGVFTIKRWAIVNSPPPVSHSLTPVKRRCNTTNYTYMTGVIHITR